MSRRTFDIVEKSFQQADKVCQLLESCHGATLSSAQALSEVSDLSVMLKDMTRRRHVEALLAQPGLVGLLPRLWKQIPRFEKAFETAFLEAHKQGGAKAQEIFEAYPVWQSYQELVESEVDSIVDRIPLTDPAGGFDQIGFVGCGSMPISPILMHRRTGCPIVCYEMDPVVAKQAEKVIADFGLSHQIRVYNQAGEQASYQNLKVVIIASSVVSKPAVINQILESPSVELIGIRTTEAANMLMSKPFLGKLADGLFEEDAAPEIHLARTAGTVNSTIFMGFDPGKTRPWMHMGRPEALIRLDMARFEVANTWLGTRYTGKGWRSGSMKYIDNRAPVMTR